MREIQMTFQSAGTTLAGTFVTPDGPGPFPAALLLAGSGPLDRDGNIKRMPLNVSRDLAGTLAAAGWASLRYDKRGIAASEGEYLSTGFFDELADAEAARDWLLGHESVSSVVVIGHSAGASQAAELAGREPAVAGAILLAATAKTGEQTLRWQAGQMGDKIVPGPVKTVMRLFGTDVLKQQDGAIKKLKATTTDVARIQLQKINAKWMREFIAYDPVPGPRGRERADAGHHRLQGRAGGPCRPRRHRPHGTHRAGARGRRYGPHPATRAGALLQPPPLRQAGQEADRSAGPWRRSWPGSRNAATR